jgi:hypothetical protein
MQQKTDASTEFFGCLRGLTFADGSVTFVKYLVEVRIPLVAGACFSDQLRTPERKGHVL